MKQRRENLASSLSLFQCTPRPPRVPLRIVDIVVGVVGHQHVVKQHGQEVITIQQYHQCE